MKTQDKMISESQRLKRTLGRTDVLTLAFGTMVGWGWVVLSGQWIKEAGIIGSIFAFAAGAILCILVGLTYAELTAALPLAGGEMIFAYRAIGRRFAWFVGWAISFVYI
ncbi:MAG TPA: amino acid permease, partial [Anaerovoracaceae bacterium]|nr:amino acid permease [Anaerovoracaceae bacterium]